MQQLQGLKECLEEQLDAALYEKEQIEEELQQVGRGSDAAGMGGGHQGCRFGRELSAKFGGMRLAVSASTQRAGTGGGNRVQGRLGSCE